MSSPLAVHSANTLLTTLLANHAAPDTDTAHYCHTLLDEANRYSHADQAAHMSPNLAPYSLLGMQLAALHRGNLLSAELYPALKQAEQDTLDWFKHCFAMSHAHFSHGSSYNNLQALWQARDVSQSERRTVYASRASHYSVVKACRILGLKLNAIETDVHDRIDITQLANACRQEPPLAIVANAGTTAAGAMDPLSDIAEIADHYQCWLHIDAAWGGAVLMLPEKRGVYQAICSHADSLCFDPHKSLFQPRPCSLYLSRHALKPDYQTDYLASVPISRLSGSYGAELFLPLWLNLKVLGKDWFFEQTRHRLKQADRFDRWLLHQGHETWNGGTGIICFSAENAPLESLVADGKLSRAMINHHAVYRAVFSGYQTSTDALLRALHPFL